MSDTTFNADSTMSNPMTPDNASSGSREVETPGGHNIKRRNRPSLNNIADQCEYDQRLLAKKEEKARKHGNEAKAATKKRKLPPSDPTSQNEQAKPPQPAPVEKGSQKTNGNSSPNALSDVCVIMRKSDLEELQSKLKQYESLNVDAVNNRRKTDGGHAAPTSPKDNNLVYNRSLNSYRGVIFTTHEETRPGYVPLTDMSMDQSDVYDIEQSVTSEIHLDQTCKREQYLPGINPYDDPKDTIPLYSQVYSSNDGSKTRNLYPLSWSYSVRNSASLKALRAFSAKQKNKHDLKSINLGIAYDPIKRLMEPVDERLKSTLNYDESSVSRFEARKKDTEDDQLVRERSKSVSVAPGAVNMSTLALELSVLGGSRDHEMTLIEQIQAVIPTKRVMWLHINRFMYLLYPFFPYVVEDEFRAAIENIIGKESYEEVKPNVKVLHRVDFAQIGILFIMLRLSYLSLFHNRGFHNEKILSNPILSPEEAEKKYLLLNQIEIGMAEIAQACFRHLERLRKVSIPMLQCGVFLRLYRIYAPEEGDGLEGGYGQIQNSILVSMSYMLGLNREPDKTPDFKDDKVKNLYRKIWYFVVSAEYNSAILFGSPVSIRKESYDTKRPFFTWQNSNSRNRETDQTSIFAFMTTMIGGPIEQVIALYSNVQGNVKVMELTTHLNTIEIGAKRLFGKLEDYLYFLEEKDSRYHMNKISKAANLLKVYSFLMLNYCFLFNFYENVNNTLSYFYLKKMMTLGMGEVLVSSFALITKSQELFGEGADLFINPTIIQILTRISDICIVGIIRSNFSLYKARANKKNDKELSHEDRKLTASLNRFITLMEKSCRINIEGLDFAQPTTERITSVVDLVEASLNKLEKSVEDYCQDVGIQSFFKKTSADKQIEPKDAKEQSVNESFGQATAGIGLRNQDHHVPSSLNTPGSVDSTGLYFSGFEDLQFDNSEQIDSIWLQMLSSKTSNQNTGILQYNTLLQQQPGIVGDASVGDFGYENVSYDTVANPQTQYANPYYANTQTSQPISNTRGQSVSSGAGSSQQQQQQQQQQTNINVQNPGLQNQAPPPNIFNYSDMFDDLPLDKLFK
ncbi:hypothetical protein KGF57_005048 [Candida theae]|uniref:Transcription factor domain-containing protein n=1 Tax=Candida theae TaxID=1198502 RepID=A0AAD5FWC9_9ASCO|nr:uncharacterized protein KGF57_005048 [Candida theae]KAI5948985.1 hypothetical protein KGF57_005048 [Candida theae]